MLTVGGGSAGHVAPVLAVIDELVARSPSIEIRFWCDRKFMRQSRALIKHAKTDVKIEKIFAGKLRRYHNVSFLHRLADIPTLLRNFGDFFAIGLGFFQSLIKLVIWRPQVVFCKGGFVCLPVGYAAAFLRIPLVIHDSDAHPGLTNRLLARFATFIATGAPLEHYNYPEKKARFVGIPTKPEFRRYNEEEKTETKKSFGLESHLPLLVVIGGGLGAKRINDALLTLAPQLITHMSVVHISGVKQYKELEQKVPKHPHYKLIAFISESMGHLLGAADVVISRAGASSMAELAAVGASVIMVPSSVLSDQQKNAKVFADARAAVVADEKRFTSDPQLLFEEIERLLNNHSLRQQLSINLSKLVMPGAAKDMADLIERAGMRNVS